MAYERWGSPEHDPWAVLAKLYGTQEVMERPSIRTLVALADARASDDVVDLATGTGIVPVALAALDEPPHRLIGIDSSEAMLARAPTLPKGWALRVGDALKTGLPDASATLVTCAWFLHLLTPTSRTTALVEIRRLLTPTGRAVLVVPTGGTPHGAARIAAPIARFLAERRGLPVLRPVPDLEQALQQSGLRIIGDTTTIDGWPARVLLVKPVLVEHPTAAQGGA